MAETPLSPEDVLNQLDSIDVDKYVRGINQKLLDGFGKSSDKRVIIDIPDGIVRVALNKILRIYRDAGWTVEEHSDQREGRWLEFRMK